MGPVLLGMIRMYCFRQGVTNVFDYPKAEARHRAKSLSREGWVIYHTVEL